MNQSNRLRHAAVNKGALIALGIVAILAAGFWGFRASSGDGNPAATSAAEVDAQQWMMRCESCGHAFPMTQGDYRSAKKNERSRLECPKCKKFSVSSTRMTPEDYAEANKKP